MYPPARPSRYTGRYLLFSAIVIILTCLAASIGPARAASLFDSAAPPDDVLRAIGVDEHPGALIPPGLVFDDQAGRRAAIGSLYGGKPAILTLNYYQCPMLCPITLANLAKTMSGMKGLMPGRDYTVLTVSINPAEKTDDARGRADETFRTLGDIKAAGPPYAWWRFMFGKEPEIEGLTRAVGFRYQKVGDGFAHPSVFIVLTPEGRVSRYLYGVEQEPNDLRMALLEASDGKIGVSTALNRVLLYCYHYDPAGRRYQVAAMNVMKAAGAATLVLLLILIAALSIGGRKAGTRP